MTTEELIDYLKQYPGLEVAVTRSDYGGALIPYLVDEALGAVVLTTEE